MVSNHNKQLFADDDCYKFAYKHQGQLDCGVRLTSLTDFSSFGGFPEKHPISDGESEGIPSKSKSKLILGGDSNYVLSVTAKDEFRSKAGDISSYGAPSACRDISNMPWITNITGEVVGLEHLKRPSSDNGPLQVAYKRPRQADQDNQVDSFVGISSFGHTNKEPYASVADVEEIGEGKLAVDFEDHENKAPSCNLNLPWFTCSTIVEDTRKLVPIGPKHQADLPLWRPRGSVSSSMLDASLSLGSASDLTDDEDSPNRWMGTCVLPMPDPDSLVLEEGVVNSKILCHCFDEGSIRCVWHHILEAREKLKKMLGQDKFRELGFYDMGEDVVHKWTEEEQHLFDEVVLSNPIALRKNFWDDLTIAFPLRSTKELVSYYFNVFMLRKRARQNRSDPLKADSDNDEWQESDDSEFEGIEEYEDSDIESAVDPEDAICNSDLNTDAQIHEESDDRDDCQDCDDGKLFYASEGCLGDKSKFVPKLQPIEKNSNCDGKDQDSQDDSCTSYEGQHSKVDFCSGLDEFLETHDSLVDQMLYENSGFSSIYNREDTGGHCDPTSWEMDYISLKEKVVDFLPTSSVIEEVLGKESAKNVAKGQ